MKKLSFSILILFVLLSCEKSSKKTSDSGIIKKSEVETKYPSDVIPFMNKLKILLGNGTKQDVLENFKKDDFFYVNTDHSTDWVVYKTPNAGITSPNSNNTRTELGKKNRWTPKTGGKLTGTLKVKHVSTTGDADARSSYAVVVGQIHSDEDLEDETLKIHYKKIPEHEKGSVFWNYEINTNLDNAGRRDFSAAVWGHDFSVFGENPKTYLQEPKDGIALGEEFSYEINIYESYIYK